MRIGIAVAVGDPAESTISGLAARAAEMEARGLAQMWMGMAWGMDPMTALAAAGQGTERLRFGTAIVPTLPRHPVVTAQGARTAQAALDGRFTLGVGVSHRVMMEDGLGLSCERPVEHLREYLSVIGPLLRGEPASFHGNRFDVEATITVDCEPVPVMVAALGTAALRVAGELSDGTITAWVGPRTLETYIVSTITAAAADAGRPAPRIAAILPMALTDDVAAARDYITSTWKWYGTLPAFTAMFEREGIAGPEDVALIGDEKTLDDALDRLEAAGVTDYIANLMLVDPDCAARTFDYLVDRAAGRRAG